MIYFLKSHPIKLKSIDFELSKENNVSFLVNSVRITGHGLLSKSVGLYSLYFKIDGWFSFEIMFKWVENSIIFSFGYYFEIF